MEEETLACTFTLLNYDDSLFSLFLFFSFSYSHQPARFKYIHDAC